MFKKLKRFLDNNRSDVNKDSVTKSLSVTLESISSANDTDYEKELKKHEAMCNKININTLKDAKIEEDEELNPEEILFLSYIDQRDVENYNYPQYWTFDYNLDFQNTLLKLFKSGYVKFADASYKLNSLKVAELKEILMDHGLKVSGRKAELIERLVDNLDSSQLENISKNDYFQMTEKGSKTLKKNQHIPYFKKISSFKISIHAAHKMILENPDMNQYSVALYILQKRLNRFNPIKENGLLRNTLYNIAIVYQDMGNFEGELEYLLIVITMDLFEGLFRYEYMKNQGMLEFYDKKTINEMKDSYMLAPALVKRLKVLKDMLRLGETQLRDMMLKSARGLPINVNVQLFEARFKLLLDGIKY